MEKSIEEYLDELKLNGSKESSIKSTRKVLERLDKFIPLSECKESDIKAFLSSGKKKHNTITIYKSHIRKFFLWQNKPELVGWIKTKIITKKLDEKNLLTSNEIETMLKMTFHPRDKALIAILSESGARIGEVLNLKIKDVRETDYGILIRIDDVEGNKTGAREIPLIDSTDYIKTWLNQYPQPAPDKQLFISFNQSTRFNKLSYSGAYALIGRIVKNAGITKKVHPHLFRHTQLTDMARQGYNESIIRQKAGWTGSSKMVEIYLHTTNRDLETATLAKHGLKKIQQEASHIQMTKECPNCHKQMPIESSFCENCRKVQDLNPVVKRLLDETQQTRIDNLSLKADSETMKADYEKLKKDMEKIQEFIKMGGIELLKES